MIKYADYFPKSMLYKFDILPERELIGEEELSTLKSSGKDAKQIVSSVCEDLKKSFLQKDNLANLEQLNLNRRVASMLCDLDVISGAEKEAYLSETPEMHNDLFSKDTLDSETRVSLEIPELGASVAHKTDEKSEQVVDTSQIQAEVRRIYKSE